MHSWSKFFKGSSIRDKNLLNFISYTMKVCNSYYTTQGCSLLWNKPNIWREVHRYSYKNVVIYMICTMFCIWNVTACFHSDILAILITFYKNLRKIDYHFKAIKRKRRRGTKKTYGTKYTYSNSNFFASVLLLIPQKT